MPFTRGNKIWVGRKHSSQSIAKMRAVQKKTPEQKKKVGDANRGRKMSEMQKAYYSKTFRGERAANWRGGITPINQKIRSSVEYKLWRKSVFERDGYACVWGGKEHGNKLQADHIKPFSMFPELRFAIDNGRTLCEECHKKTDTYKSKALNHKH